MQKHRDHYIWQRELFCLISEYVSSLCTFVSLNELKWNVCFWGGADFPLLCISSVIPISVTSRERKNLDRWWWNYRRKEDKGERAGRHPWCDSVGIPDRPSGSKPLSLKLCCSSAQDDGVCIFVIWHLFMFCFDALLCRWQRGNWWKLGCIAINQKEDIGTMSVGWSTESQGLEFLLCQKNKW